MSPLTALLVLLSIYFACGQFADDERRNVDIDGCPRCEKSRCPTSKTVCVFGRARDLCGCCPEGVCARIEGEECFNASLTPPPPSETKKYGICGTGLRCLYNEEFDEWDIPRANCVCEDKRSICGSDNKTYNSICDLKLNENVFVKNIGPCPSTPRITKTPENIKVRVGEIVILTCEARGFPTPILSWKFIPFDRTEGEKQLPGDLLHIAVQTRGGPDSFMATAWVQIMHAKVTDQGLYICIAENDEGINKAAAEINIQ